MKRKIIKEILGIDNYQLLKNPDGISNQSYYLLENHQYKYVIREKRSEETKSYENEIAAINLIKNLDYSLKYLYYDREGNLITKYQNIKSIFDYQDLNLFKIFAKNLKNLHQRKFKIDYQFKVETEWKKYYHHDQEIDDYLYLFDFDTIKYPLSLCHNDLVRGNIQSDGTQVYIIDYEYAAMNYYVFDIASFLSENILSKDMIKVFLTSYFDNLSQEIIDEINQMIKRQNLLWYLWAKSYYHKTSDQVYHEIMTDKYQKLISDSNLINYHDLI